MTSILMYHQVADIPLRHDPRGLAVPPGQFEQQMGYLARKGYKCLTLREAVRRIVHGGRTPAKSFVLTFDDGYQDVHTTAWPILERFGFTATVFLVAGRIGCRSDWAGQEGARSGMLLSWAEARDLARRGFVLGSHTLSHPRLRRLDDQSALKEIRESRVLLQEQLGVPVDYFSYPYSDSDARIERLVERAGYTAACAGDSGPWSAFHLWRVQCLRGETALSFAFKANGWFTRRTAWRESAPGRLLRRAVRTLRNPQATRRRQEVSGHGLGPEP
jgi:peptidoglycan/xylan/chitin deacetylase (PgdA/CDA1 family)